MEEKIFTIIKSWAGVSTWYTHHPLDNQRFSKAMVNLVEELGSDINLDDFRNALCRHANNNPATLGQPKCWDDIVDEFVLKAEAIIKYEKAK